MNKVNQPRRKTLFQPLTFLRYVYVKLPHKKVRMVINSVIDFCFDGEKIYILDLMIMQSLGEIYRT